MNKNRVRSEERSRNQIGKVHYSMSVAELVKVSQKDAEWGLSSYQIPRAGLLERSPQYSIPKQVGMNFIDQARTHSATSPSPGAYETGIKWSKFTLGTMKGEDRRSFLDQVIKTSRQLPSPDTYSPERKYKLIGAASDKTERIGFFH